jgi:1-aminocyclopropane-1-carboxylate deaminase/D-cysteine desulfhydrase-like pyridoxal-dependent ACC family enzyme
MDGEAFSIQVSFVSFAIGSASTVAGIVLGMNDHPLEGFLLWMITALVTFSFARYFYNKFSSR